MSDLVTALTFKPPRLSPASGKLHTIASFTIADLVEVRALIVEDLTGAACLLWPSILARGGCRIKTVRLSRIEDRDAAERTVLDAYRAGRQSGELPGQAVAGKGDVSERPNLAGYLEGVRAGKDWLEGLNRLPPRAILRIVNVMHSLVGISSKPIPKRDEAILGVLERRLMNEEIKNRREKKRLAAKAAAAGLAVKAAAIQSIDAQIPMAPRLPDVLAQFKEVPLKDFQGGGADQ